MQLLTGLGCAFPAFYTFSSSDKISLGHTFKGVDEEFYQDDLSSTALTDWRLRKPSSWL